jgi:hypothetical protein
MKSRFKFWLAAGAAFLLGVPLAQNAQAGGEEDIVFSSLYLTESLLNASAGDS